MLPLSRQGADMTSSFPEIRAAALAQLPAGTGLDGVMWLVTGVPDPGCLRREPEHDVRPPMAREPNVAERR